MCRLRVQSRSQITAKSSLISPGINCQKRMNSAWWNHVFGNATCPVGTHVSAPRNPSDHCDLLEITQCVMVQFCYLTCSLMMYLGQLDWLRGHPPIASQQHVCWVWDYLSVLDLQHASDVCRWTCSLDCGFSLAGTRPGKSFQFVVPYRR